MNGGQPGRACPLRRHGEVHERIVVLGHVAVADEEDCCRLVQDRVGQLGRQGRVAILKKMLSAIDLEEEKTRLREELRDRANIVMVSRR